MSIKFQNTTEINQNNENKVAHTPPEKNLMETINPKNSKSNDKEIQIETLKNNDPKLQKKETKRFNSLKSLIKFGKTEKKDSTSQSNGFNRLKSLILGETVKNNNLKITFFGYIEYILTIILRLRKSPKHKIISKQKKHSEMTWISSISSKNFMIWKN